MPNVVFTPQPQSDALSSLGNILLQSSRESLQRKEYLDDQARVRDQILQDQNRNRDWQLEDYNRQLTDRRTDVTNQREYEDTVHKRDLMDETIKQLVQHGYITQAELKQPNSPELISGAIETSRKDGLDLQKYAELKNYAEKSLDMTGDEKAFIANLDPRDVAGMDKASQIYGKAQQAETSRNKDAYDRTTAGRNVAGDTIRSLTQRSQDLQGAIDNQGATTPQEDRQIDLQLQQQFGPRYLALAANDKTGELSAARTKLRQQVLYSKQVKAQDAVREQTAISRQITALSEAAARNALGASPAPAAGAAAAAGVPPPVRPVAAGGNAMDAALGIAAPPTGSDTLLPAGFETLPAGAQAVVKQRQIDNLNQQLQAAQAEVDRQTQALAPSPAPPPFPISPTSNASFGFSTNPALGMASPAPSYAPTSSLLQAAQAKADAIAKVNALKQQIAALSAGPSAAPVIAPGSAVQLPAELGATGAPPPFNTGGL